MIKIIDILIEWKRISEYIWENAFKYIYVKIFKWHLRGLCAQMLHAAMALFTGMNIKNVDTGRHNISTSCYA